MDTVALILFALAWGVLVTVIVLAASRDAKHATNLGGTRL